MAMAPSMFMASLSPCAKTAGSRRLQVTTVAAATERKGVADDRMCAPGGVACVGNSRWRDEGLFGAARCVRCEARRCDATKTAEYVVGEDSGERPASKQNFGSSALQLQVRSCSRVGGVSRRCGTKHSSSGRGGLGGGGTGEGVQISYKTGAWPICDMGTALLADSMGTIVGW